MNETAVDMRAAAGRALVPDLPADVIALPHWQHHNTTLLVSLNAAEHARREDTESGALPYESMGLLDALMTLPVGIEVPLRALEHRNDRRRVRAAAQAGAVDVFRGPGGLHVVRRAERPLHIHLAVVSGPPMAALSRASGFAPFCARAAFIRKHPSDDYLFEASFYGIGVAVGLTSPTTYPDGPVAVLAPEPWVSKRRTPTPAGWSYAETAYKQILAHPNLIPTTNGGTA